MFAIILDKENYIESYSSKFRTPESVLVDSIPDESNPEKLKCYQYMDGGFTFDNEKWASIEAAAKTAEEERAAMAIIDAKRAQIDDLKATLAQSDYKIIKCQEYALNGLELPYDIESLHLERQGLRDQINELEAAMMEGKRECTK